MANEAEKTLSSSWYHTEGQTFNFEKLVLMHLKAHIILEGLVEHGYVGIDERSKVCHLMESIKTMALDSAKAQIMANADLRTSFNACVNLFKDFISGITIGVVQIPQGILATVFFMTAAILLTLFPFG
jgi:hypothetical protein